MISERFAKFICWGQLSGSSTEKKSTSRVKIPCGSLINCKALMTNTTQLIETSSKLTNSIASDLLHWSSNRLTNKRKNYSNSMKYNCKIQAQPRNRLEKNGKNLTSSSKHSTICHSTSCCLTSFSLPMTLSSFSLWFRNWFFHWLSIQSKFLRIWFNKYGRTTAWNKLISNTRSTMNNTWLDSRTCSVSLRKMFGSCRGF